MLLDLDPHSGVPIFRQMLDQIRRQITTGQLPAGEQAPSVRDLAAALNVNPMTVSKTYSLLEAEGLLERRRGVGLFVSPDAGEGRQRVKREILEDLLKKAAQSAVQFNIPEHQAIDQFQKLYRKLLSAQRRLP